jgi:hypothetical protein
MLVGPLGTAFAQDSNKLAATFDERFLSRRLQRRPPRATRTFTTKAYVNILEKLIEQFVEAKPLPAVGSESAGRLRRSA